MSVCVFIFIFFGNVFTFIFFGNNINLHKYTIIQFYEIPDTIVTLCAEYKKT